LKPVLGGSLIFKEPLVLVLPILSKLKNRLFGFFDFKYLENHDFYGQTGYLRIFENP
jgi:hypothetical protein